MKSNNESGHAKNVANFEKLAIKCESFGEEYNPFVPHIQLPSLKEAAENGRKVLSDINKGQAPLIMAINERDAAFMPLSKLTTRSINALKAAQVSPALLKDARGIANKIQGKRTTPKNGNNAENGEGRKNISTSQTSFDNRINNLDRFIKLLEATPEYKPNEAELKTENLNAHRDLLLERNKVAFKANTEMNKLRITRNDVLYDETAGLVALAKSVKAYLRSAYGTNDPRFKAVNSIPFRGMKKK
jgi:hypothetical protein